MIKLAFLLLFLPPVANLFFYLGWQDRASPDDGWSIPLLMMVVPFLAGFYLLGKIILEH